jgi:hypothetical protein
MFKTITPFLGKIWQVCKKAVAISLMLIGLGTVGWYVLKKGLEPEVDAEFIKKLDAAIARSATEGAIPLASIVPEKWDVVCYINGAPTRITRDLPYFLSLPKDVVINIRDGSDVITDDEWALVFYDSASSTAFTKFVSYSYFFPYNIDVCLKGRNIYLQKQKVRYPHSDEDVLASVLYQKPKE